MGVTVFHSLTATTPDNTQYEIRPSHWNSNHVASLSLAGSDLSNAFSNSPTVTFGTSGGLMTASVNTAYVALSNSSSIMPIASSTNFLGTAASGSFIATSVSSSIMPIASSSNFLGSAASGSFIATSNSSLFQQTSATSAITSAAFPSAQTTKFAGTGTTFSGTNVSGSMTLNSNGLNLALSAGAGGGGNFSAGISTGGNTSGVTGTVSNQIVFVGGNNVTLSGSTAAGGATVTISGANIGGAQTGISGVAVSNTTYTSGTFSFRDGNNISFASGTGQGVSITHNLQSAGAYLTTAMQSNAGSNFLGTNTALTANGVSMTANSSGLSLNFPAFLTSQSNQAFSASGGSSTFQTLNFANSNGVTFSNSGGSIVASYTVPTVPTAYVSSVNGSSGAISLNVGSSLSASTNGSSITFGLASNITTALQSAGAYLTTQSAQAFSASGGSSTFQTLNFANSNGVTFSNSGGSVIASVPATSLVSGTGIVSISTNGGTISIGAPAMSVGLSNLGNTSGNTGTVSNQFVLAGGNNITLSGSTNAAGMTVTVSANTAAAANLSVSAGTTSGAFGGLTFANSNNVTFGLNNGTITASAPSGGGGGIAAAAGSQTQTSGTVLFSNSNGITFGMSNSSVITASYTVPTVPTAYVSSVNGSSGAISLNVGSSLSASTNGSSITFGLASNITTALQSAGAYLTTAAQSSASNVSQVIVGTAAAGGTATLTGGVSFSNANGISFYSSAGNAVVASYTVPTVPTAYVSSVNGSSGAISLNVGSSLSASTNGSSITFGLASNITTALQSAGAYLTTQSAQAFSASGGSSTFQTLNFANSNGVTFSNSGGSVVASYTVPTVPTAYVSSVNGSSGAISLNVGSSLSASTNGSSITFGLASNITTALQSAGAYLTTAAQSSASNVSLVIAGTASNGGTASLSGGVSFSNANGVSFYTSAGNAVVATVRTDYLTTQSAQAFSASGGSSTFQTLNFANSNGVTFSNSGGSVVASVPATSSLTATGAVSISTNGNTISIGAPAFSAGVTTLGNTLGNTGTVSNQLVLAGGNNITLSGSTAAGGMTLTISGPNVGGAQTGISGIIAGTQTQTAGTVSFANGNGISFGMSNSSVITASYTVPTVPTAYVSSVNGSSGAISLNVGSSLSASTNGSSITFGLASNITTALQSAGAYLTTQSAQAFSASGGSSAFQTLNFANSNGVTFSNSGGSVIASYTVPTVPTAYVSSVNGSSGAISLNVGSSLSASTNGSSITFGLASNITTALQSAGAYLTTAAQSSASNVSLVIAGTAPGGGTASLSGGVSFSNANGVSFYTSAGNAIVASIGAAPTAYVSSVNGSSGAISLNVGSSLSASTNGSSITFGLASNITTALQSANANYLTSQSNQAFSASGGSSTFQTLNFANSNGVTFSNSGGSVVASYTVPTVPTAYVSSVNGSSGAISLNVGSSLSASTNGSSITFGLASNITTALQSANANYLTSQSNQAISGSNGSFAFQTVTFGNSNGLSFYTTNGSMVGSYTVPTVPTQTNQTVGFYGSSQTTGQSSSSTFDARSMSFVGAGGISVGASNGSIIFSGATGGGGGGGVAFANSQTTYTSGTVSLREGGGAITIASNTGQRIDISVPGVSSLFAGSGVALSSTSNSIYLYNDFHDIFVANIPGQSTTYSAASNVLVFAPMFPVDNYSFTCFEQLLSFPGTSTSASAYGVTQTHSYALYKMDTANSSQMSLVQSSSAFFAVSASGSTNTNAFVVNFNGSATSYSTTSNASGILTNIAGNFKVYRFPFAGTLQAGEVYYLGQAYSISSQINSTIFQNPRSMVMVPVNVNNLGYVGPDTYGATTQNMDYMGFSYTTTSGAWPSTIATSQTRINSSGVAPINVFKNVL